MNFNSLKFLLISICLLNKLHCFASGKYDKFKKTYPRFYDSTMPATSSSPSMIECICGYSTDTIAQDESKKYTIFALTSVDFNTKDPLFKNKPVTYTYGDTGETQFSSAVQWFSAIDGTFRSYSFQLGAVKATLSGFLKVYEHAGNEENDFAPDEVSCTKEILFLDDMSKGMYFNAVNGYDALVAMQKYESVELGKDLSKVTKTRKEKFLPYEVFSEGNPMESKVPVVTSRWNFITCNFGVTYSENVTYTIKSKGLKKSEIEMTGSVPMTFIFADGGLSAKYFMIKLEEVEYTGIEGINQFKKDIEDKPEDIIGIEQFNNIKLFNFDVFVSKETMEKIEEDNIENTKEILLNEMAWPNKFQFDLCSKLLNSGSLGNPFGLSNEKDGITDYGKNIWNYWNERCPILAWTGKIIYNNPIFEGDERQVMHGMISAIPENLYTLTEAKDDELALLKEIKTGMKDAGIYKQNNYYTEGGDIEFVVDETYEEFKTKIDDKIQEIDEALKEAEDEKPKELTPISEDIEGEEAYDSQAEIKDQDDETELDETEQGFPDESELSQGEDEKNGMEKDYQLLCAKEMKRLELKLKAMKEPKDCKNALEYAFEMMYFPRGEEECIDRTVYARFENLIKFEKNTFIKGKCRLLCLFEGHEVSVDHALIPVPKPDEDPIKCHRMSFELIFENKTFENPKTMMLYVPQMDAFNEWDKYTRIFESFKEFFDENNAEKLNLRILKKTFTDEMNIMVKGVDEVSGWILSEGPTGPDFEDTQGLIIDQIMDDETLEYIFHPLRLSLHSIFYDLIYESWYVGDYIMIRIQGSQLDYTAMLHQYAHELKIKEFTNSIFEILRDLYLSQNIISMMELKKFTYDEFKAVAKKLGYVIVEKKPEIEGEDDDPNTSAYEIHQEVIENIYPTFNFLFYEVNLEIVISVYGFIHGTENLPTLNLFFKTELFESEYLVPLSSSSQFNVFLIGIYTECLKHMISLLMSVRTVENPNLSDDDLKALQLKGRYNFPIMVNSVKELLSKYIIYGCISDDQKNLTDKEDEEIARKFKWDPDVDSYSEWDSSGRFTIRRSNQRLNLENPDMCLIDEALNPIIVDVYPTLLDGNKKGYAVNLGGNVNGKKMNVTYYIVAYQDYPHMKTFEYTINSQLSMYYNAAPVKDESEGDEEAEERKLKSKQKNTTKVEPNSHE